MELWAVGVGREKSRPYDLYSCCTPFLKILHLGFYPGEPVFDSQEEGKNNAQRSNSMNDKIEDLYGVHHSACVILYFEM